MPRKATIRKLPKLREREFWKKGVKAQRQSNAIKIYSGTWIFFAANWGSGSQKRHVNKSDMKNVCLQTSFFKSSSIHFAHIRKTVANSNVVKKTAK
ncbi:hypothetical protein [Terasakiella brassicae]|uniref:hypothetical protein n=1 Tax=Terasakiella brassicae TaxID=1634917 RepID=UPI001E5CA1AA|nr:hypothetical protein [Terasakiella brassicae]